MTIKFVLLVNKQGQTRLAKYTDQSLSVEERRALEGEIVRKCLARSEKQVSYHLLQTGMWTHCSDHHAYAGNSLPQSKDTRHQATEMCILASAVLLHRTQEYEGCIPAVCIPLFPCGH